MKRAEELAQQILEQYGHLERIKVASSYRQRAVCINRKKRELKTYCGYRGINYESLCARYHIDRPV